ncbi:hypothetical protein QBC47DRAFT_387190 [Echria macrotheca]|uniref:Uncharacterized protein n=1 Tax=Echria macrotheca TaxID=438768 RepID=A0AAJ0B8U7_9PEZI|nr:hypothetical protein QBC47DRAFT_387190 [Echria macrotheca]
MKSLTFTSILLAVATPALATTTAIDTAPIIYTTTSVIAVTNSPPPSPTPQTGCPTVTATRELCATCPVPLCLGLATVTQSCGCPDPVPTVFLDYPCSEGCAGIKCSTSYAVVTATATCGSPSNSLNSTKSLGSASATKTGSVVQVNGGGRMEVPWGRWFV